MNRENDIYVCDLGLSSSRCDFIMDIAERCSNGSYHSYTYAKQTLGCREYDELAVVCEWPVMRAVATIREYLQIRVSKDEERELSESKQHLVLDNREPHIVKYDVSRKERQKLVSGFRMTVKCVSILIDTYYHYYAFRICTQTNLNGHSLLP